MKNKKCFILLIIPFCFTCISFISRTAAGPFWQYADPCYQYLFNALHMLKGIAPTLIAHPGTPLQILILFIAGLCNIGHTAVDTLNRVLINPEFYLYFTYVALTLGTFLTSLVLAAYIYHKTQDIIAALLSQLPALSILTLLAVESNYPILPAAISVSPDNMLISVVNLFNLFYLRLYFAKTDQENFNTVLLLAFACGLGVATKLTFLPLVLTGLFIVPWRLKFLFSVTFVASFILCTLPIISRYPLLFQWTSGLLTHTGHYGLGGAGVIDWNSYLSAFKEITRQWGFFVITTTGILIWSSILLFKNWQNRNIRFLWVATLGSLLQYLITAKHFSFHYLLPGIGLFSSIFVLFYLNGPAFNTVLKKMTVAFIIIFSLYYSYQAMAYCKKMSAFTQDLYNLRETIHQEYPNCSTIPAASIATNIYLTQEHGLFLGNYGSIHKEDDELAALYPHTYYFDTENTEPREYEDGYGIRDFHGRRIFADDILASGSCSIFLKLNSDFSQYPYTVRQIKQSTYASAYLLTGSTEKQAEELFAASLIAFQKGDYRTAFMYGLKCRELNFQPRGKIEYYLALIYQKLQKN